MGCNPDLIGARIAIFTHHGTHGVGTVTVVVTRSTRRTNARRIEPVVIVIERTIASSTPILRSQRWMGMVDASIDVGNHDSLAPDVKRRPREGSPYPVDTPLDTVDRLFLVAFLYRGDLQSLVCLDPFDRRIGDQLFGQHFTTALYINDIGDPELLV